MSKPLNIGSFSIDSHTYACSDKEYAVKDIIKLAKDLPVFEIPLQGIYIGGYPWGEPTIKNFIYHMSRVNAADLKHPIILDIEGYICDGWHRLSKAILDGHSMIKAVRLEVMPEPINQSIS